MSLYFFARTATVAGMGKDLAFLVSPAYIGWACAHCAWAYPGGISVRPEQIMDMQREFNGHWCGDYPGASRAPAHAARHDGEAALDRAELRMAAAGMPPLLPSE